MLNCSALRCIFMLFGLAFSMIDDSPKKPERALREVPSLEASLHRMGSLRGSPKVVVEGDISLTDVTGATTEGMESVQVYQKLGLHPLFPEENTSLRALEGFLVARPSVLGGGYFGLLNHVSFVAYQEGRSGFGVVHAHPYDLLARQRPPKNPPIEHLFYKLQTGKKLFKGLYGARVSYIPSDDRIFNTSALDFLVSLADKDRVSGLDQRLAKNIKFLFIPLFEYRERDESGQVLVLDAGRVMRDFRSAKEIS